LGPGLRIRRVVVQRGFKFRLCDRAFAGMQRVARLGLSNQGAADEQRGDEPIIIIVIKLGAARRLRFSRGFV
jgi:hypothetical protein